MKTNQKFGRLSAAVLLALVSTISPWGGCTQLIARASMTA